MMALVARIRSVWSDGQDGSEESGDRDSPSSRLFECSTCDVVYIADEKETCSNCGTEVQQVRATLHTEGTDRELQATSNAD